MLSNARGPQADRNVPVQPICRGAASAAVLINDGGMEDRRFVNLMYRLTRCRKQLARPALIKDTPRLFDWL